MNNKVNPFAASIIGMVSDFKQNGSAIVRVLNGMVRVMQAQFDSLPQSEQIEAAEYIAFLEAAIAHVRDGMEIADGMELLILHPSNTRYDVIDPLHLN